MITPLSETYRPQEFEDLVGVEYVDKFKSIITEPMEFPNLLFWGPRGVGKTTAVRIILNKLQPIDVLRLNGSDKNDRNIDTMSNKVTSFGMSKSSVEGKPKIIFLDEMDNITPDGFEALRGNIEKVIKNCRFIATANYFNKIPEPIQSRFTCIEFKTPKVEDILPRIINILDTEKIKYDLETIKKVIELGRGDIRTILNNIQFLTKDKEIKKEDLNSLNTDLTDVFKLINNKEWSKIRYEIPNRNPDYHQLITGLDEKYFKSELPIESKIEINDILAKGQVELDSSFNKDICFSAICSRIIKVI